MTKARAHHKHAAMVRRCGRPRVAGPRGGHAGAWRLLLVGFLISAGCSEDVLVSGGVTSLDAGVDSGGGALGDAVDISIGDTGDEDTGDVDTGDVDTGDEDTGDDSDVGPDLVGADADAADPDAADPDAADPDAAAPDAAGNDSDALVCPICPAGYLCRLVGGPPRCVADPALSCLACVGDLGCLGGVCASAGSGPKGCLLPCPDPGGGCADGYACVASAAGPVDVCVPLSGSCGCPTGTVNAEVCNGADDDCDGAVDEPFKIAGQYATAGHCGACSNDCGGQFANGVGACVVSSGVAACALAGCAAGYVLGNDGSCVAAPPVGQCTPCGGGGACPEGLLCTPMGLSSVGSVGSICTAPCAGGCSAGYNCIPSAIGDRCLPKGGVCTCTSVEAGKTRGCGLLGAAASASVCAGIETCVPSIGWLGCTAKAPGTESCNGADDDCNGLTDEGGASGGAGCAVTNAIGSCSGVEVCKGAAGTACDAAVPSLEVCNDADDDCDGLTDEGFVNAAGLPATVGHCGACDNACPLPLGMASTATCTTDGASASCGQACVPGWVDADGVAANGCECKYQSPVDEPDGADQDCDGVDGSAAKAIFVAKTGSDTNPGTRLLPQRTLAKAIATATSAGKPHVYAGAGVYTENVDVVAGVSLFGGYAAGFSVRDPLSYQTVIGGVIVAGGLQATARCKGITAASAPTPSRLDGLTIVGIAPTTAGASSYAVHSDGCDASFRLIGCQVIAGPGAAGKGGAAGQGGAEAGDGNPGLAAIDVGHPICDAKDARLGGNGGVSTCGADGGKGGAAICPIMDEEALSPACPAQPYIQTAKLEETGTEGGQAPGSLGVGGSGGKPGWDSYIDIWNGIATACKNGPGCGTCRLPLQQRGGSDGNDGGSGPNGAGGLGGSDVKGAVLGAAWVGGSGTAGSVGHAGGGGGGGGAAGGVEVHGCEGASAKFSDISGSGGGGGSGGCGGLGGAPGAGGGGSFAVMMIAPPAIGGITAKPPMVLGNLLVAGQGGGGGTGGPGGGGGNGGKGSKGGPAVEDKSETFCTATGGDGGDGGDGGHGGGGGGGAGGASAAVLVVGFATDDIDPLATLNQLVIGKGGGSGVGGPAVGNAGKAGTPGLAIDVLAL